MARAMTVAELVNHILQYCPERTDKAIPFLTDVLGRFQLQAYRRGQRSVAKEIGRIPDFIEDLH